MRGRVDFLPSQCVCVGGGRGRPSRVLQAPSARPVGTLSLAAATCAALGLAIGALAPSADLALAAGIPVMIVHMALRAAHPAPRTSVPSISSRALAWGQVLGILNPAGTAETKPPSAAVSLASHASPIKWSIRALCCAELRGMELERRAFI